MPDAQPPTDFTVHDVLISNQTQFDRAGAPSQVSVVTYYVGSHGPFTLTYRIGEGKPEKVRADMAEQVKQLRELLAPLEG